MKLSHEKNVFAILDRAASCANRSLEALQSVNTNVHALSIILLTHTFRQTGLQPTTLLALVAFG